MKKRKGGRALPMLGIAILALCLSGIFAVTVSADSAGQSFGDGHILYIPIPSDVTREDFVPAGDALKSRLYRLIAEEPAAQHDSSHRGDDMVIIFLDHEGVPILPDLEEARSVGTPLHRTTPSAPNVMTFTYHSPDDPWEGTELAELHKAAGNFSRVIKKVYGDPAFTITVNVRKDPNVPFLGAYSPTTNEILLRDASSLDVFCHEIIHAFRDDDMIRVSNYEEGMTVAAEVEVFNRLRTYTFWDEHHEYPDDVFYEGLNTSAIIPFAGEFDYTSPLLLLRYQLAGYAWGKVLLENPCFLAAFNRKLYREAVNDPDLMETDRKLYGIASALQPMIEGKPFAVWYGQQAILASDPPEGSFLYLNSSNFVVYLFDRDNAGNEHMVPGAAINWAVYDYRGGLFDRGSDVTSDLGWISFAPNVPASYRGRIKLVVSGTATRGEITSTSLRSFGEEEGVFGILPEDESGFIDIIPLDHNTARVRAEVANGAFSAPDLTSTKGQFIAVFTGEGGTSFSRQFNKDASSYFLLMTRGETSADLSVSQSGVSLPATHDVVFTVTVANTGPDPATDLALMDTLNSGASLVSAVSSQGSCVMHGSTLTCALNSLSAGSAATVTITARPSPAGCITNAAEVTENGHDPDITNNAATSTVTAEPSRIKGGM